MSRSMSSCCLELPEGQAGSVLYINATVLAEPVIDRVIEQEPYSL